LGVNLGNKSESCEILNSGVGGTYDLTAHNRLVGGSSPPGPTNKINELE
jgi:hypothetical protein